MPTQDRARFDVIVQPTSLWAKQMKWGEYDSTLNVLTMSFGTEAGCEVVTSFMTDLVGRIRNAEKTIFLVIYDRWDIFGNQMLSAGFTMLFGQTYYVANPSTELLMKWLGLDDLSILIIYGTISKEDDLDIMARDFLEENVGMHIPDNASSILYAGHDNTYLGLITRSDDKIILSKISEVCRLYGMVLNVILP